MGDAEEIGETRSVGALADSGTAEKDPLDIPVLEIAREMERCRGERGGGSKISTGSD